MLKVILKINWDKYSPVASLKPHITRNDTNSSYKKLHVHSKQFTPALKIYMSYPGHAHDILHVCFFLNNTKFCSCKILKQSYKTFPPPHMFWYNFSFKKTLCLNSLLSPMLVFIIYYVLSLCRALNPAPFRKQTLPAAIRESVLLRNQGMDLKWTISRVGGDQLVLGRYYKMCNGDYLLLYFLYKIRCLILHVFDNKIY